MAALAECFPKYVPGLMSHLLTVLRAHAEFEDPAWRVYDESFREKMAAKGERQWSGMDIQLFQEICGGRSKRLSSSLGESRGVKRQGEERRKVVCWKYNEGKCPYGSVCRFPHVCETCSGKHPKIQCPSKRQKFS